jgi:hypothetical protein
LLATIAVRSPAELPIIGSPELVAAEKDVLEAEARGHGVEPATHREVGDRTLELGEGLDDAGRDRGASEDVHLRHVVETGLLHERPLLLDLQDAARLPDAEAVPGDVQRAKVVARGYQPPDVLDIVLERHLLGLIRLEQRQLLDCIRLYQPRAVQQGAGLVGQTDADERAADALRAIDERRRDASGCSDTPCLSDGHECRGDEVIGDRHTDTLPGLVVVDDRFVTAVAVVAQDQRLYADLDRVCLPRFERPVAIPRGAVLVVHRRHSRPVAFDEVDDGREPMAIARQRDRTRVNPLLTRFLSGRQRLGLLAQRLVAQRPFDGIVAVRENALDPLIEEEPRAVDEFVEHPRGQVLRQIDRAPQPCLRGNRS